jgi:putative phosphoesterase
MKIGILSDTHDNVPHIKKLFMEFNEKRVDAVLHAGDFCSPFMIPEMKAAQIYAVLGNNDGDVFLLQKKCNEQGIQLMGAFGALELGEQKIALYHGTYSDITQALINCGSYDIVVTGHTHDYVCERHNQTWHLNPGTAHGFGGQGSAMILETSDMTVERLVV